MHISFSSLKKYKETYGKSRIKWSEFNNIIILCLMLRMKRTTVVGLCLMLSLMMLSQWMRQRHLKFSMDHHMRVSGQRVWNVTDDRAKSRTDLWSRHWCFCGRIVMHRMMMSVMMVMMVTSWVIRMNPKDENGGKIQNFTKHFCGWKNPTEEYSQ